MVKQGRAESNLSCVFSTLSLLVCVCLYSVGTWVKSKLLILKMILFARRSPNLDLGRAQESSGTADLAVLA